MDEGFKLEERIRMREKETERERERKCKRDKGLRLV